MAIKNSQMTEKTKALRTTNVTKIKFDGCCYLIGRREKFRECMHGILHMEQHFKGEYSSISFVYVLY